MHLLAGDKWLMGAAHNTSISKKKLSRIKDTRARAGIYMTQHHTGVDNGMNGLSKSEERKKKLEYGR